MTLETLHGTNLAVPPLLDRFSVTAASGGPDPLSQPLRSAYVEENWLPYVGPTALLFARRCDNILSALKDGQQSLSVIVSRWASDLGIFPEEVVGAKNRLVRWAFATWDDKTGMLSLKRHWPPVPPCITTPEHRALLLAVPDLPTFDDVSADPR
jgi:hypothetical protein